MILMGCPVSAFADEIDPDFAVQLDLLRRLGIDLVDLRSAWGTNVLSLTEEQLNQIVQIAAESGIGFECVGSPVNKVDLKPENRESELANLARSIEIARKIGVDKIRIFTPRVPPAEFESAWPELKAWMREQVELAEQNGMTLLHENDADFYGAYPDNAQRLFSEFGGRRFRAAFDFANTVLLGFRPMQDWFNWITPHLETLHIKDAVQSGRRIVPAGEGDGQILEVFRWLHRQNWHGTLSMEPHLAAAGERSGFSGADLFTVAVEALKETAGKVEQA
ncbi:MAG: TIM barrel protein [Fimbriimonadaceae bacterium]